jgi:hypothetical protein
MLVADVLTFREFMMAEPLPLATVQQAVLEFLRGRDDAVLFGAQAVNAYVAEPRMTQDLDLLTTRPEGLAQELAEALRERFHIAVRTQRAGAGQGLRLYQVRKGGNRHLVDLRAVPALPAAVRFAGVLVLSPVELIASKVIAYQQRRGQPKSGTDWRDLAMLLLAFPDLQRDPGTVRERLVALGAGPEPLAAWAALAAQPIRPATDDDP